MSEQGALTFARFAFPPNDLGYCGPKDSVSLLEHVDAGTGDDGLTEAASHFAGAWPYLTMIAGSNGIRDPLDLRVVEAYWIGNHLLDHIDRSVFGADVESRFGKRAAGGWSNLAPAVPSGGLPHHSFHVFAVYPWIGLLRSGTIDEPLRVLDRCRIGWGTVEAVSPSPNDGDDAIVSYRPLAWESGKLTFGAPSSRRVFFGRSGRRMVGELHPGDRVALHWDWICARLDRHREDALASYTRRTMDLVNGLAIPGPATVLS